MKDKKIIYSFIGIALLLMVTVGVTYSFFNYTRTGAINNLGTGTISFNSVQNGNLNMTNIFPMKASEVDASALDSVTVSITGNTTYSDGEEFQISLVDVKNVVNGKKVPLNFIASYVANTNGSIGNSNNDYWNARENKSDSIYLLHETGKIEEGAEILAGYINDDTTGINGTLTIKAYVDADRIAITDTPDENSEWQQGRTVFSTSEWNSFQGNNAISFKIKAESNEGIWIGKIDTCPDCKFMFPNQILYKVQNASNKNPTNLNDYTGIISPNYYLIMDDLKNEVDNLNLRYSFGAATDLIDDFFIGVNVNSSNEITKIYLCSMHNGTSPYCLEGDSDGSKYNYNKDFLQSEKIWNNSCTVDSDGVTCGELSTKTYNAGSPRTIVKPSGVINVSIFYDGTCGATCQNNGDFAACAVRYYVNGG